jgi:hypothetical protein
MGLITAALSTFSVLIFVLGCLPFRVPAKMAPLLTGALAYGMLVLDHHQPTLVDAAAVASLVALCSRYIVTGLPEPWDLNEFLGRLVEARIALTQRTRRHRQKLRPTPGPVGNRISKL